jgi:hypothetical protein
VKNENGNLLADSHNFLKRWKNYFSQLLNVHSVSDVRQIQIHTAEPLVPCISHLEVEIAVAKFEKCKSPGSDQIRAELIQARSEILLSAIHKLINSVRKEEELPDQWKESIIVPIHKKNDKTGCNNYHEIIAINYDRTLAVNIMVHGVKLPTTAQFSVKLRLKL